MPKFCVKIKEVHTQVIEVDADDKQAALAVAQEVVNTGVLQDGSDLPANVQYEYMLDFNESNVWKAE